MTENQKVLKDLCSIWLHLKEKVLEFNILFAEDEETENLREELLPDFFDSINDLYWNYFLITIARLLDEHNQGRNRNLSIFILPEILKKENNHHWRKVQVKIDDLKIKYRSIIDHRRKNLAHFDLDHTTGEKVLETSTNIDEVNEFLTETLDLINFTLENLSLERFSVILINPARFKGANQLLRILKEQRSS